MRIIIATGPRSSAELLLPSKMNLKPHEIKFCGYPSVNNKVDFTWSLHPEMNLKKDSEDYKLLLKEVKNFDPQLVITDFNFPMAKLAEEFEIPIWHMSPLHLIGQTKFEYSSIGKYTNDLNIIRSLGEKISISPDKILILSPFGNLAHTFKIRTKAEWCYLEPTLNIVRNPIEQIGVFCQDRNRAAIWERHLNLTGISYAICHDIRSSTYLEILSKASWLLSDGVSQVITDCLQYQIPFGVAPSISNPESLLNATISQHLNLGKNLGEFEYLQQEGPEYLFQEYEKKIIPPTPLSTTKNTLLEKLKIYEHLRFRYWESYKL